MNFCPRICCSKSGDRRLISQWTFPPGTPFRIPIISVTGTNGKTTTTRLIAHIIEQTGTRTGFTTSDGVYVNGVLVEKETTPDPVVQVWC
ncbi:MAG: hypothetical protein IPO72_12630 [Saprospiraceae bacterium]|nr:hypothetical protein [Candidatus Vicinibacter affinis]